MIPRKIMRKIPLATLTLFLFVSVSLLLISLALSNPEEARRITREDGLLENLQAGLYLLGAGIWFISLYLAMNLQETNKRRLIFHTLMALMFIVLFLEEISYGQRILGTQTPEFLQERNLQNETNLHNFGIRDSQAPTHTIGGIFFVSLMIVLPYARLTSTRIQLILDRNGFPTLHRDLVSCVFITLAFFYEPDMGIAFYFLAIVFLIPIILILTGRLNMIFSRLRYPLMQFSFFALIGIMVIYINANSMLESNLSSNVAFEFREVLVSMIFFFFAAFELGRLRRPRNFN